MRRLLSRLVCLVAGHAEPVTRSWDVPSDKAPLKLSVTRCSRCAAPLGSVAYAGARYPLRRA
jgi:hypothetical protein